MTPEDALTLVDYHYWARDRILEAVEALSTEQYRRPLGSSFSSVRDTVVHVYFAEWAWYLRWTGRSPTAPLSPELFPDLASVRAPWALQEEKIRRLVGELGTENRLHQVVVYRLMSGEESTSTYWQMLQHVVNHASYHRGQITTMLRQLGGPSPKSQDLIRFYRERDGQQQS